MYIYCLIDLQNPGNVPSHNSRIKPLSPEPVDYTRDATVEIPLDSSKVFYNLQCLDDPANLCDAFMLYKQYGQFSHVGYQKEGDGASSKRE